MKGPGMTLMVLAACLVLAESQGAASDINYIVGDTWCNENMEYQSNFDDVIYYCVGIINDLMKPDPDKGCEGLYYVRKSRHLYDASYDDYFNVADVVYDLLCVDHTVTTVTDTTWPITTPYGCGKSDSLVSQSRRLLSGIGRIVGGTSVRDCSVIPWQVRLQVGRFLCGGSIISDRHILTASHCVEEVRDVAEVEVTLADHNVMFQDTHERVMAVQNITMHENYDPYTYTSDIAILTLEEPIKFDNPCVAKICRDPYFKFDSKYCTVSGWGTTFEGGMGAEVLQMVLVKAHDGDNCDREFEIRNPGYVYNKQQMVCAGHLFGGKDSCQGDSGGPLVCLDSNTNSFVQVGVVSFGQGCAEAGLPGVYSNVAYFHDWIQKIMAENNY